MTGEDVIEATILEQKFGYVVVFRTENAVLMSKISTRDAEGMSVSTMR
jgi:hypothetical protein